MPRTYELSMRVRSQTSRVGKSSAAGKAKIRAKLWLVRATLLMAALRMQISKVVIILTSVIGWT